MAYGTKTLKLSDKQSLEIPNVVRTVTASRLVDLYVTFCKEEEFAPLGRSSLFNILKVHTTNSPNIVSSSVFARNFPIFRVLSLNVVYFLLLGYLNNRTDQIQTSNKAEPVWGLPRVNRIPLPILYFPRVSININDELLKTLD